MRDRRPDQMTPSARSLPLDYWPRADRLAWDAACRPAERLRPGGAAAHLKVVTRNDLAQRYGYFVDHVNRVEGICPDAGVAAYVTPDRVARYITELNARVRSVTVYGSVYKLRRMAQLLAPGRDFAWLTDIEKDLALVMQPRSKFDRLVWTNDLVEAGISLMEEADAAVGWSALAKARQFRNGLMIGLLALCPIRLKNFATLEIGRTFKQVRSTWWIVLSATETKEGRADERPVPEFLGPWIDRYRDIYRPMLARNRDSCPGLWLSAANGSALTYAAVERIISDTTLATVGTSVSPHSFRTAAASTSAVHAVGTPRLGAALLHHTDARVTDEYYNRSTSLSAGQTFAALVRNFGTND